MTYALICSWFKEEINENIGKITGTAKLLAKFVTIFLAIFIPLSGNNHMRNRGLLSQ